MNVILYKKPACPKCQIIAAKLAKAGINYEINTDIDYMISIGIKAVPTLEVDGTRYSDAVACNNWIKSQGAQP